MPVLSYELTIRDAQILSDIASKSYTESTEQTILVADAAADSQLNFGGVTTADVVYMKSTQALTVNLNSSSGTDITLDANHVLFLAGTAVTAIYVSNASGSTATLTWAIWGA